MRFSRGTVIAGVAGVVVALVAIVLIHRSDGEVSKQPRLAQKANVSKLTSRPARILADRSASSRELSKGKTLYGPGSDPQWQQIAGSLNPAKARELLDRDRLEEKNINVRAENAWSIINQLCKNGFSKEAWDMIDAEPGLVRQKSLNGFFRDAGLPKAELLGMLNGLEKKERAMGLSGYWDRFPPEEFARLDMSEFEIRSPDERAALRQSFESMVAQAFDPANPEAGKAVRQQVLNFAADQVNQGLLAYGDFGMMMKQDPSKDGFAFWDALSRVDPELRKGQDSLKGTDSQVIRAMTVQDPERTLNMTLVEGSAAKGKGYVALEQWLTQDFRKAEQWFQQNQGKADPDSSAVAFMRACGTLGKYQEALDWYAKIQNQNWLNGVGGEMRSIQRQLEAEKAR